MSISESSKAGADQSNDLDPTGSQLAAASGMPDPALLARMANDFFRAIPGEGQADAISLPANPPMPASATDVSSVSSLTIPSTTPSTTRMPTEADLQSLPTTASIPSAPGIPGGFSMADISAQPSFSFLQEARSIFAGAPAVPVQAVSTTAPIPLPSTAKIPTEAEFRNLTTTFPGGTTPPINVPHADLTVPQIPGAAVPVADFQRMQSFNFLEEAKPLERIDVVPSLSPISSDLGASSLAGISSIPFDVQAIRRDFPILQERVNGRQLVWLDNAATTHKPQAVIDRLSYFYTHENSNIHRAAHTLAARATDAYEAAREKVRRFLNASSTREIIFVRGATEAINLVAQSWGRRHIQKDDEIVITWLEHHANIVPWQMLCAEKGAKLRVAPVDNSGQILLDEYEKLLGPRTRLVSLAHVSNALGTVTPVNQMVAAAHRHGAKVLVDGAQAVSHMRVDVQEYDCDFYVFSGHKVFAPTGIGVVYGKSDVLENTPPWQGGGNMISDVTFEKTTYQPPPGRFEAGTGSIGDAVGLDAAIDYLDRIGMVNISRYEHDLLVYATEALQRIPGLHLIGTAREKASVLSFVLDGFRTEDVGAALNKEGIAVRSGHHCAQPILRRFGVESTVRPSLALYNTCEDVDALVNAVWNLKNGRSPGLL